MFCIISGSKKHLWRKSKTVITVASEFASKSTGVKGLSEVDVPTKANLVQGLDVDVTAATLSWAKGISIDRTPSKPAKKISITVDKTKPKFIGMMRNSVH